MIEKKLNKELSQLINEFEKLCVGKSFWDVFNATVVFLVHIHEDIDYEKHNTSLEEHAEEIKNVFIATSKKNAEIMSRNNQTISESQSIH